MRAKEFITEKETYQPPSIDVGDKILVGKFKNRKAEVKGFKTDKNNHPILKTNKGDQQLFKPRIEKLMTEDEFDSYLKPEYVKHLRNRPKGIAPHEGSELRLLKQGKPAAILLPHPAVLSAIKENNWSYIEHVGYLLIGTTKDNLQQLINAFNLPGYGSRDIALGKALGYPEENIEDWLIHSGRDRES